MKKLLSLVLSLVFVFSFCACGEEKKETKKHTVDIEYFAKLGEIPEATYALGEKPSLIEEELTPVEPEDGEDHSHDSYFEITEKDDKVLMNTGAYIYCYLTEKEEDGISYIVSYDTAFEIKNGSIILQVKEALGDIEYTEEEITSENAFFLFGEPEGTVLKCKFKKHTVAFFFVDNALTATTIYLTDDWE